MITVIIFALIAHIGYAGNDFSGALGARKFGGHMMSLLSWTTGLVITTALLPFLFHNGLSVLPVFETAISGVLLAIAYPIFLKCFENGNATITGVIAGSFPLWVVILSILFLGERLTVPQTLAIATILVGVALSSLHLTRKTRLKNLFNRYSLLAFIVSIIWGIAFTLLKYPSEKLGWFEATYINGMFGAIATIIWIYPSQRGRVIATLKKFPLYPLANSMTGFGGTAALTFALTRGNSSIVAPIAGSYGGLFAIMSYLKFKEKLTKLQILGVLLIFTGVVALSIIVSRS